MEKVVKHFATANRTVVLFLCLTNTAQHSLSTVSYEFLPVSHPGRLGAFVFQRKFYTRLVYN